MTNFRIIQKRTLWITVSTILFVIFLAALIGWGFKFGIDFTGGSLLEVKFIGDRPALGQVQGGLTDLDLGSLSVQPVDSDGYIIRFQDSTEEKHQEIMTALNKLIGANMAVGEAVITENGVPAEAKASVEELRFDSVGPSIGQELKRKSVNAIFFVLLGILIYITYAFRKVSKPVASWKYGASAVIAMFHDVIIMLGIFAVLGRFYDIEIDTSFVAAALTVMGYSVHDTIVVFDRIRENLPKSDLDFEGTVNKSLNQTLVRSINTTLTVLLTLVAIIIFGGESIRTFALALTIGIVVGTYSSIFLASPLLVVWEKIGKK